MDLETFREQLVIWGITPSVLMFVGVGALITLFFSLRVVTKWFIGTYELQEELKTITKQLSDIQMQISLSAAALKKELHDDLDAAAEQKTVANKSDSFRLTNH